MIIECSHCRSRYQYDENRFDGKPSKKIKCAKCQQIFEIFNPAMGTAAQPAPQPAPRVAEPIGERTAIRRDRPRTVEEPMPAMDTAPAPDAPPLQMPAGNRLSLAVIDGPDAGNVFRIEKPRVTIGRSGADLNLSDNDASRQHAAVEIRDTSFKVVDLGSTNGTIVEGEKISGSSELVNQGEFQIGSSTIMLIVTDES